MPALLALSALAMLSAMQRLADTDAWWHLAGGRLVLAQGIPRTNTFAHTWPDEAWQYTQWLFGVLLRLFELLGGPAAAVAVSMLLVGTAVALSLDTVRRRLGRLPLVPLLPLLALVLAASRFRFVPRPHLVTFVGLALLLNLRERRAPRLALWFGLTGALWANSHAGVVFGLGLAVMMPVADALIGRWAEARGGAAAAAAFFAGTLVNPYGLYPYAYSFQHLSVQSIVPLAEFRHASLASETIFFLLAIAALAAVPAHLRRRDLLYPLALASFLTLAVDAVRVVPKFLIVVWPGLAAAVVEAWERLRGRSRPAALAAAALFALAAGLLVTRDLRAAGELGRVGWGVDERTAPAGAAAFILRHDLPGRMFNEFDQGGYLAWRLFPRRRVFLDGRVQAYPAEFFREYQAAMHGDSWGAFLGRYGVDYAVVQRRTQGSLIDLSRRFQALGWPLVFLDGVSLIYVRPESGAAAAAAAETFKLIRPGAPADELAAQARSAPAAMRAELARIDPARLVVSADFQAFGVAAAIAGDLALAERFLAAGVREDPRSAVLHLNRGTVLLDQGRRAEALEEFRAADDLGRGTPVGEHARRRLAGLAGTR